jgi:hypothetical protein|tara:strand:+ start:6627 stop:7112 length:486 start_codon:yes stop_codon:yes gene_type:complete
MINFICTKCEIAYILRHYRKELTKSNYKCLKPGCGGSLKYENNYAPAAPRAGATSMRKQVTEESIKAFKEFQSKKKSVDEIVKHLLIEWRSPMFKVFQESYDWTVYTYPTANEIAYLANDRYGISCSTARKEVSKLSEKMGTRKCNVTGKTCTMRLIRDWE